MDTDVSSIGHLSDEAIVNDIEAAFHDDPDLVVMGFGRHSDGVSDLPASPPRLVANDDDPGTQQMYSDISSPSSPVPLPSSVRSSSPSVIPETEASDTRPSSPVPDTEPEVIILGADTARPPVRPVLQPPELLAAVHDSSVNRAAAVARRLSEHFDTSRVDDVLPTFIALMHVARADVARTLLDDHVRALANGTPPEAINAAGLLRLLNTIANSDIPGFQFLSPGSSQ